LSTGISSRVSLQCGVLFEFFHIAFLQWFSFWEIDNSEGWNTANNADAQIFSCMYLHTTRICNPWPNATSYHMSVQPCFVDIHFFFRSLLLLLSIQKQSHDEVWLFVKHSSPMCTLMLAWGTKSISQLCISIVQEEKWTNKTECSGKSFWGAPLLRFFIASPGIIAPSSALNLLKNLYAVLRGIMHISVALGIVTPFSSIISRK
jgi:hypothetical protein